MKIDKEKFNWYNFDHEAVNKEFEGDLTYCGTFCVLDNYLPVAVYKSKKPNISKGHKKYMLLGKTIEIGYDAKTEEASYLKRGFVSGLSTKQMSKERYQAGIWCPVCGYVIYSVYRHDFRTCECESCFIDGGKEYLRSNIESEVVDIDLITGKWKFR